MSNMRALTPLTGRPSHPSKTLHKGKRGLQLFWVPKSTSGGHCIFFTLFPPVHSDAESTLIAVVPAVWRASARVVVIAAVPAGPAGAGHPAPLHPDRTCGVVSHGWNRVIFGKISRFRAADPADLIGALGPPSMGFFSRPQRMTYHLFVFLFHPFRASKLFLGFPL